MVAMTSCKSILLVSDLIDSFPALWCSLQYHPFCTCMLHTRLRKPFAIDLRQTSALHCESRLKRKRKTFKKLNRIIRNCFSLRETPANPKDINFCKDQRDLVDLVRKGGESIFAKKHFIYLLISK